MLADLWKVKSAEQKSVIRLCEAAAAGNMDELNVRRVLKLTEMMGLFVQAACLSHQAHVGRPDLEGCVTIYECQGTQSLGSWTKVHV